MGSYLVPTICLFILGVIVGALIERYKNTNQ